MPGNDADAIAAVAEFCAAARAKLPASGFHRLRVLLDMILIDLARAGATLDADLLAAIHASGDGALEGSGPDGHDPEVPPGRS